MSQFSVYTIGGRRLQCQHCGGDHFSRHQGSVDRMGLGFFHMEAAWGHQVDLLVCRGCRFVHMFMSGSPVVEGDPPEEAGQAWGRPRSPGGGELRPVRAETMDDIPPEATRCLSCGKIIAADVDRCAACGWSWEEEQTRTSE